MRATSVLATILMLLPSSSLAQRLVDADPSAFRPRHRHHSHPVRVHSDPPGIKWTEMPPEPSPAPRPVHTLSLPPTTPLFSPDHLLPPSLPTITPATARAYCITHGLSCAPSP